MPPCRPRAAAIYARISSDGTREGLGVQRQLEDCRALAARQGWTVGDEYVDNGISAYKDLARPQFDRMLADIAAGERDAVIVWKPDRISRRPAVIERFLDVCGRAGLKSVASADQVFSLGDAGGLFSIRLWGLLAAQESGLKSERLLRKAREVAEAGRPNGGNYRPFGYEADRCTIRPAEAEVVRQLARRALAGESLRSLVLWLRESEIPTVSGVEWRTPTVRQILTSPRVAGLRAHRGEIVAKAVWEPIITEEDRQQLLRVFAARRLSNRRAPQNYLLSGMLRCGRCGNKLFSSRREHTRRYVCSSGPDHGGCGRLTVVAAPLEDWIVEAVLYRLDSSVLADALAGRHALDGQAQALAAEVEQDGELLAEFARMAGAREMSVAEWKAAREPVEARIQTGRRRLSRMSGTHALDAYVGQGTALRGRWADLVLDQQVAVVRAVLDHATVLPGTPGARGLDPARIEPTWAI